METPFLFRKSSPLVWLLFGLSVSACQASDMGQGEALQQTATASDTQSVAQSITPAKSTTQLSEAATQGLLLMYEEEKLAHDVYMALYDKWQVNRFNNIAQTESRHQDAVEQLLKQYNIPYASAVLPQGSFANQELQKAYDQLVAKGLQSEAEALKVGAYVEELDIDDLNRLNTPNLPTDIKNAYDWLTMGSRNHLRAFYNGMRQRGVAYTPQILSQGDFDAIINGSHERGMGRGYGGGGHGNGHGGGHGRGRQ